MRIAARPDASEVCISKNGNATYGFLFYKHIKIDTLRRWARLVTEEAL